MRNRLQEVQMLATLQQARHKSMQGKGTTSEMDMLAFADAMCTALSSSGPHGSMYGICKHSLSSLEVMPLPCMESTLHQHMATTILDGRLLHT